MKNYYKNLFGEDVINFIHNNYKGTTVMQLVEMIKEKFNMTLTYDQIRNYKTKNNLQSGLDFRFKKGQVSYNKGKKMSAEQYERCKHTMFKKGNIPHNTKQVGDIVTNSDGYLSIKIADPNKWKLYHVYLWEKEYGPIPKTHCITFLDGDITNVKLDNLMCIKKTILSQMNIKRLKCKNAEINKANIGILQIQDTIKKRSKEIE